MDTDSVWISVTGIRIHDPRLNPYQSLQKSLSLPFPNGALPSRRDGLRMQRESVSITLYDTNERLTTCLLQRLSTIAASLNTTAASVGLFFGFALHLRTTR